MRSRGAVVVAVVLSCGLLGSGCGAPRLDREGARSFSVSALRASGLRGVSAVREAAVDACSVEGASGWRTVTATEVGEVSMCVSRDQGRALSVRDPGMTDEQFTRLERYRGETSSDRALPLAAASASLALAGVLIQLLLAWRDPARRPALVGQPPASPPTGPT